MFQRSLVAQARVIRALILRDLRTRFGRTFFGPMILIIWPLSHGILLMATYVVGRRFAPLGTDATIFFATGVLPYILCCYPGRTIMLFSIHVNRSLLQIPVVKPVDLVAAQCISQAIISFWVVALFSILLFAIGTDIVPKRPEEALFAVLATVYLGMAIGSLGAVIYSMVRAWLAVQFLTLILLYFSSGALFVTENLPEGLRRVIWFNPLFHCVEWFRLSFYDFYNYGMLSRSYVLGASTVMLWLALIVERGMRGRILEQH